jgi:glucose/arabinose dehydrogenase
MRVPVLRVFWTFVVFLPAVLFISGCGGGSSSTPQTAGTPGPPGTPGPVTLGLTTVVSGLSNPVDLETPDDNSGRLFVVEQPGRIKIISNGSVLPTPFLDITSKVNFDGAEQGLLGVAFHPNFSAVPKIYVNYDKAVTGGQETIIAEFTVSAADLNQINPASERDLIIQSQPFTNHKAGQLVFGLDGFLYFGLGDGGNGGDPLGNGQNLGTLLGKMMRIDVDHTSPGKQYAIPSDNPFVGGGGLPEIFAFGFRNPWRFSLDRPGQRFFVADVGQNNFEEIDILAKGANFGWNTMEGSHCFNPPNGCDVTGLTLPIFDYSHADGVAVIGGYVYHGSAIPSLQGTYIFGDLTGPIWNLVEGPPGTWTRNTLLTTGRSLSSFGQDASGELYVLDLSGIVLKLVAQ